MLALVTGLLIFIETKLSDNEALDGMTDIDTSTT